MLENQSWCTTTYDQTCIRRKTDIAGNEVTTYVIAPRPVCPLHLDANDEDIIRGHIYEDVEIFPCYWDRNVLHTFEWHPNGDVLQTDPDGTTTLWPKKPTLQDVVSGMYTSCNFRFYADGSCRMRTIEEGKEITMFWFEDRIVDEPSDRNWMTDLEYIMGKDADMIDIGWSCRKCYTKKCSHVNESARKFYNKYGHNDPHCV